MDKYLEKCNRKFVIATLDIPTQYLISQNEVVCFTTDIDRCTKYENRSIAKYIKKDFYISTGMYNLELVILPVFISYEIGIEDVNEEVTNN